MTDRELIEKFCLEAVKIMLEEAQEMNDKISDSNNANVNKIMADSILIGLDRSEQLMRIANMARMKE